MSSILKLNRLIVMKSGQRAYDQKFHSGLNIIHGSNGSGKSSILDFIFFALGGNLNKWKPVAQGCDTVFAEISANGTKLSLRRDVSTDNNQPMFIYFGSLQDGLEAAADGWQRYPYSRNDHSKTFSQILFKALNLPEIPGDEGSNITMHQILRLMYEIRPHHFSAFSVVKTLIPETPERLYPSYFVGSATTSSTRSALHYEKVGR